MEAVSHGDGCFCLRCMHLEQLTNNSRPKRYCFRRPWYHRLKPLVSWVVQQLVIRLFDTLMRYVFNIGQSIPLPAMDPQAMLSAIRAAGPSIISSYVGIDDGGQVTFDESDPSFIQDLGRMWRNIMQRDQPAGAAHV